MHPLLLSAALWSPVVCACAVAAWGAASSFRRRGLVHRCTGRGSLVGPVDRPRVRRPSSRLLRLVALPNRCGYDLSASPSDVLMGHVIARCPECGCRSLGRDPLRRLQPAARALALGLLLLLPVLLLPLRSAEFRQRGWTDWTPTPVLLSLRHALGEHAPHCVRAAIGQRLSNGEVNWRWCRAWAVDLMIDELRDDEVKLNADVALFALRSLGQGQETDRDGADDDPALVRGALEHALASADYQQRQFAAHLLRCLPGEPSDTCLRVTVEGLRDDAFPSNRKSYSNVYNGEEGIEFLIDFAHEAEPHLAAAITNPADSQQEFLAAAAAAVGGCESLHDACIPILVKHLGDNFTENDSRRAVAGLLAIGPRALPHLEAEILNPDPQLRRLAALLCRRITDPAAPPARLDPDDPARITALAVDATTLHPRRLAGSR